jgi:hypothetical protein
VPTLARGMCGSPPSLRCGRRSRRRGAAGGGGSPAAAPSSASNWPESSGETGQNNYFHGAYSLMWFWGFVHQPTTTFIILPPHSKHLLLTEVALLIFKHTFCLPKIKIELPRGCASRISPTHPSPKNKESPSSRANHTHHHQPSGGGLDVNTS